MSVFDQKTSCRMVNFRGQDEESTNKNTELEEQEDNEIPKKTNDLENILTIRISNNIRCGFPCGFLVEKIPDDEVQMSIDNFEKL
ncbi:unnamed protein product [Rhizophagus irregularis]|nr:unnamed protein product [Rhizophagus irregularis]